LFRSWVSSACTWPDTVVLARPRDSAARVKLPSSTMRQKARIASNRSKAIVRFSAQCLRGRPIYLVRVAQYSGQQSRRRRATFGDAAMMTSKRNDYHKTAPHVFKALYAFEQAQAAFPLESSLRELIKVR